MASADAIDIRAVVRYDGSRFSGWQVQPNARTVQGVIEGALSRIASRRIAIEGSGRTDAGVHALGQVFSFRWPGGSDLERLRRALCKMLGPEVRLESLEAAPPGFHARKHAVSKRYAYVFCMARFPDPFTAPYAWTIPWALDMTRLDALAQRLTGRRNFAGFQGGGSQPGSTVRTMHRITVARGGIVAPRDADGLWHIVFQADGFLYKMVRNITGTLVDIARGRLPEERLDALLGSPAPYHGHTAPPHGLFLLDVDYGGPPGEARQDDARQTHNAC